MLYTCSYNIKQKLIFKGNIGHVKNMFQEVCNVVERVILIA